MKLEIQCVRPPSENLPKKHIHSLILTKIYLLFNSMRFNTIFLNQNVCTMTFLERFVSTTFNAGIHDFPFIDTLIENFEVDISTEKIAQFNNINDVINYIYMFALIQALKQTGKACNYEINANARASSLNIKTGHRTWQSVHSLKEIIDLISEME